MAGVAPTGYSSGGMVTKLRAARLAARSGTETVIASGGEFAHGYTYSGHPAACAVALANLQLMRDEGVVERVKNETAPYFNQRWATLAEHPIVGEARSLGLVGAIELVRDRETLVPAADEAAIG